MSHVNPTEGWNHWLHFVDVMAEQSLKDQGIEKLKEHQVGKGKMKTAGYMTKVPREVAKAKAKASASTEAVKEPDIETDNESEEWNLPTNHPGDHVQRQLDQMMDGLQMLSHRMAQMEAVTSKVVAHLEKNAWAILKPQVLAIDQGVALHLLVTWKKFFLLVMKLK